MKAVQLTQHGDPSVLQYVEVPKPTATKGTVVVKNDFVGINFIDTYLRSGLYKIPDLEKNPPVPHTLGREAAGIVESVGEDVTDFKVGDRVAYLSGGAYAEFTAVPADKNNKSLFKLPEGVNTEMGAALLLQGLTCHYLLRTTFPVKDSHTILVHAGAGGLGQLMIKVAKHRLNAKVITTVSNDEKRKIVEALGADLVIVNYADFDTKAREFTGGKGVDVVYDSVGLDTYKRSLASLRPLGYLVLCGNASGAVPPIDPLELTNKGSIFLTRPTLNNYISTPEEFRSRCEEIFGWIKDGVISVPTQKYPLKQASEAHIRIADRKSTGKILLVPQNE